jgi:integrase
MAVIVREKVKGSGEWWIFINHHDKRRSKKIGSKKAANSVAKEVEQGLARGDLGMVADKAPTLSEYGTQVLESPLNGWEGSTIDQYRTVFRLHIKPVLGHRRLSEIKKRDVKGITASLQAKGLSPFRVETVLQVLRIILNHGIEDEYLAVNPCNNMSKYLGKKPKKVNVLNAQEAQELVEAVSHLSPALNVFFVVKMRTGLRIAEMAALEWSDVDFETRTLNVTKQWDWKRKETRPPKNDSQRVVRLSPQAAEMLQGLYQSGAGTGLIFPDEDGSHLSDKKIRRRLASVAPKKITPHDLRHTYATLRIAKGDNIVDVSNQLGHKNIKVTLDTYTHWVPSAEYVQQVDELDTLHLTAPYAHPEEKEDAQLH